MFSFVDNSVPDRDDGSGSPEGGGALYNYCCNETYLENCVFADNSGINGGAVYLYDSNGDYNAEFSNCTFYNNDASTTNGGDGIYAHNSDVEMTNCILWGNDSGGGDTGEDICLGDAWYDPRNTLTDDYCVIENLVSIGTNYPYNYQTSNPTRSTSDPDFRNVTNILGPDEKAGTWDDGLRLNIYSTAIDTGLQVHDSEVLDTVFDLVGVPRYQDGDDDSNADINRAA